MPDYIINAQKHRRLFTSESVTEGHPDKVCDRISDAILDEVMRKDPYGRVACECCATTGLVMVFGEISTTAKIDIVGTARRTLREIGYTSKEAGLDSETCAVMVCMDEQSPDIAMGTNDVVGGAGDQGMMFGYACNETPDLMPLPITLANQMAYTLSQKRKDGTIPFILPDGKTQVTVEYGADGRPTRIDTIVISAQHKECATQAKLAPALMNEVIKPVLKKAKEDNADLDIDSYSLYINPTGRFVKGGPAADSGLTGRKIIVDTYGGYGAHGGGAFSGKDPTKVDRSGAYMARYVAKNIVAAGLAEKCQVQLAYAIGVAEPVSVRVDTFGTGKLDDCYLAEMVTELFPLTPSGIIGKLKLRAPIYKYTSAYGHFGMVIGEDRTWEHTDMVALLQEHLAKAEGRVKWKA